MDDLLDARGNCKNCGHAPHHHYPGSEGCGVVDRVAEAKKKSRARTPICGCKYLTSRYGVHHRGKDWIEIP